MIKNSILLTIFIASLLMFISSCEKDKELVKKESDNSEETKVEINKEILKYHQNIATLAKWYANHPNVRKQSMLKSGTQEENTVLEKFNEMELYDENDNKVNFFDLEEGNQDAFLKAWQKEEAELMNDKMQYDTLGKIEEYLKMRNDAFDEAMSNKTSNNDPYYSVRKLMVEKEQLSSDELPKITEKSGSIGHLWYQQALNGLIPFTRVGYAPFSLSPQTFVNNIKNSARKGRLLIAIPGGYRFDKLFVFYINPPNSEDWWDVGHIGILSKNTSQINSMNINQYSEISIGAQGRGVINEPIKESWSRKHGISYVGQVFKIVWYWYHPNWYTWIWKARVTDVNNNTLYNKAYSKMNKRYCFIEEMLFAKWFAPNAFICSSLAWYAAKYGTGVNIGDWWKPSIFPGGVFLSSRVRIIDNTIW